jgi:uncharacterized protein (TIGR02145 family)
MKMKICDLALMLFLATTVLSAQDYLISFTGSGSSTTVTTVKVDNLTQGTSRTMNGADVLHLMSVITGIESNIENKISEVSFFPNPMINYTRMQFDLPETGETIISLYDLSGREICRKKDMLVNGQHTYKIEDIEEGIYFVRISCGRYSSFGKLISSGLRYGAMNIEYEKTTISQIKPNDSKGTMTETVMQYDAGDRLKLTGGSGSYSTVIIDVPTASKTINFSFIPCTDQDGNNYPVVTIGSTKGDEDSSDPSGEKGTQIWMAENLKTTKLNDGTIIELISNDALWDTQTVPAMGWLNNNLSNKDVYGGYYNIVAVLTGKLCPTGWRVPDNNDWNILFNSLGGSGQAGGKLKATGLTYWQSPNTGATNESGFTGLAGGSRYPLYGTYSGVKYLGSWWTSTQPDPGTAYFKELQFDIIVVNQPGMSRKYGRNVRCVKE